MKNQPIQHFYALIACCSQAMGAIIYGVCEFKDGFVHIPAVVSEMTPCRLLHIHSTSPHSPLPFYTISSYLALLPPYQDWPPTFEGYLKLKYFWFVFIFLNSLWVIIPAGIMISSYNDLNRIFSEKNAEKKKK